MIWSYDINLIQKEEDKLVDFFSHYLPSNHQPQRVLNFCCGIANEEPVLQKLYGKSIDMLSFDMDQQMEEMAKDLGRKSFKRGKIEEIDSLVKNNYDLVIGRNIPINPNRDAFEYYEDNWTDFLDKIKNHIEPEGYLIMTFARDDEFYRANEILHKLDYRVSRGEENSIIIPSDRIGIAGADIKDNYVILAQKPNQ